MDIEITLHNIKTIEAEKIVHAGKYYWRDITFHSKDGTKQTITVYGDDPLDLEIKSAS